MAKQRIVISWENASDSEVLVKQITAIVMKHGKGDLPHFWGDLYSIYHRNLEGSTKAEVAKHLGMTPNQFYQKLHRLRRFLDPYLSIYLFTGRENCGAGKSKSGGQHRWVEAVHLVGQIVFVVATIVSKLLDLL